MVIVYRRKESGLNKEIGMITDKQRDELYRMGMDIVSGCCDPMEATEDDIVGECPDCGAPVDEDGDALFGCSYSPLDCETCGTHWCDGSC